MLVKLGQAEASGSVGKENDAVMLLKKVLLCIKPSCRHARVEEGVTRVIATKTEVINCPPCYINGEKRCLGIRLTDLREVDDVLCRRI